MAVLAVPVIEGAGIVGAALLRAGAALLGGAAVAGTASLSGDTAKEQSEAKPVARTLPRTGEPCKKCPPEAGNEIRRNHGVNWVSYRYQARITGFAFDNEACLWSNEWEWLGVDFDGFQPEQCMLQEAKGDYDQFLDEDDEPKPFFKGFTKLEEQMDRQASRVTANPPARLTWYFMTPNARAYLLPFLTRNRIASIYLP
ncbi:restriction endonuclease fold toxin 5 domain-containing protein [Robbsia andropogonis]|uniref:restriction endonuclease fold toxin 5 domain-containing protein n=1 Tax=Robbsia andropogonis TaxID=28092 RepID=UPI003D1A1473